MSEVILHHLVYDATREGRKNRIKESKFKTVEEDPETIRKRNNPFDEIRDLDALVAVSLKHHYYLYSLISPTCLRTIYIIVRERESCSRQ